MHIKSDLQLSHFMYLALSSVDIKEKLLPWGCNRNCNSPYNFPSLAEYQSTNFNTFFKIFMIESHRCNFSIFSLTV